MVRENENQFIISTKMNKIKSINKIYHNFVRFCGNIRLNEGFGTDYPKKTFGNNSKIERKKLYLSIFFYF